MNQIYDQIYPIQDEKEYIFSSIASALSGISKRDRSSLFLLGKSSAGKSLLMNLHQIHSVKTTKIEIKL